ncbi:probable G-protein coupled receptor 150, partial [Struthio camelus]|uniref:probable G-protein coupled receptor 150 n=1 Tax=Struthio camelus TaxID=8801 RepID=UPI003603DCD4
AAELRGPGWPPGAAACRLLPLLQGCGPLASAHVLVLLALERHHAVRRPARPPLPARGLAALGWLLAPLLALPQAFVFRPAPRPGGPRCRSVFEELPRWHGLAYAAYRAATGFVAPACLLCWAYGRIVLAVWAARGHKAAGSGRHRLGPAAGAGGCGMPRARARTLQLTLVLIALFALCRLPRCALELGLASAPARPGARGPREALAALGIVAAANSALNPFAYLLFQSHRPWARRLQRGLCGTGPGAACCCPGLEAEPRHRATHRALHRPRRRPCADPAPPTAPGAAIPEPSDPGTDILGLDTAGHATVGSSISGSADPRTAISGPAIPGHATAGSAISGSADPGAAILGPAIPGHATAGSSISGSADPRAAISGPAAPLPGDAGSAALGHATQRSGPAGESRC